MATILAAPATAQASSASYQKATRYDLGGRLVGTISPPPDPSAPTGFLAERRSYDGQGRLWKVESGALSGWQDQSIAPSAWTGFTLVQAIEYTYDVTGRKTRETTTDVDQVITKVTDFSYDAFDRVSCTAVRMNSAVWASQTDPCLPQLNGARGADRITKTIYDAFSRPIAIQQAFGTDLQQDYVKYTYTASGKRETITDANGNVARLAYDGFDRLIAWSFPSSSTTGSTASCSGLTTITETTDQYGQLVVGPAEGRAASDDCEKYAYDRKGNRTKLMKRDGAVLQYKYDALDRAAIKNVPSRSDLPSSATQSVFFGYDLQGHQTYARFGSATGEGVTTGWDGFGRMSSSTLTMDGVSRTLTYRYDNDGNKTRVTFSDLKFAAYDYDGIGRPTKVWRGASATIASYTYDSAGRRLTLDGTILTEYGYDRGNRVNEIKHTPSDATYASRSTFQYNPASQIWWSRRSNDLYTFTDTQDVNRGYDVNGLNQYTDAGPAVFSYDRNGNMTGDRTSTYRYDNENRMVEKIGTRSATLRYDPLGRLYETSGTSGKVRFLYDGDALIAEYNETGELLYRYVHGSDASADDPIAAYDGATYNTTTEHILRADWQGSIVLASNPGTSTFQINTYDEYGRPGKGNNGRFQYTGQTWLRDVGLYYYKARFYSPTLGRFMQTDPIGYDDQINLYAYVANDPVNGRDPTGLECTKDGRLCTSDVAPKTTTSVQNTPAMDKAMQDNASQVRVSSSGTTEKIGFLAKDSTGSIGFRNPADAKTGSTSTQDNARARSQPGDVAVMHGHIPGQSQGMQDDTQRGRSLGDSQPLTRGLTNGTVMGNRLGVHEAVGGVLQFRMIDGKMTSQERRDIQRNLNDEQRIFP